MPSPSLQWPRSSRRTFLQAGLLASAGTWPHVAAAERDDEGHEETPSQAAMYPYQFTPSASFRVVEGNLDWRPSGLPEEYVGHIIEYDRARSVRAHLFTAQSLENPTGRRFSLSDGIQHLPGGQRLVGVGVDTLEA